MFEHCRLDCSKTLNYLKIRTAKLLADEITKDGIINPYEKEIFQKLLRSLELPFDTLSLIRSEIKLQPNDKSAGNLNEARFFSKLKIILGAILNENMIEQLCYKLAKLISHDPNETNKLIEAIFKNEVSHKASTSDYAQELVTNEWSTQDTKAKLSEYVFEANSITCHLTSYKSTDFENLNISQAKIDWLALLEDESVTYPCLEESSLPNLTKVCEVAPEEEMVHVIINSFSQDNQFKCNDKVDESCIVKLPDVLGFLLQEVPIENFSKNDDQLLVSCETNLEIKDIQLRFHFGSHHILDCHLNDLDKKIHERIIGEIYFHRSMSILQ